MIAELLLRIAIGDLERAHALIGDLEEDAYETSGRTPSGTWLVLKASPIAARFLLDRALRPITERPRTSRALPADERRISMIAMLWQEMGNALRLPMRAPAFVAAAAATIALGVGANTAIFSIVNTVLLEPLPYEEASRLVRVWPGETMTKGWIMTFEEAVSFEALAGYGGASATLTGVGRPLELDGGDVTREYFGVMRAAPLHGRTFADSDHAHGADPVVVLSHSLWVRAFDADAGIVGQLVSLADDDFAERRVIGVMPASHQPLDSAWDFWVPVRLNPKYDYPGSQMSCSCWNLIARLDSGVGLEAASAETRVIGEQIHTDAPDRLAEAALLRASAVPFLDDMVGDQQLPLLLLLGAVSLVLLIACTNVANLLLARGEHRRRELAIRAALGASQRRLAIQLLAESITLGLAGGALGLLLAQASIGYFRAALAAVVPRTTALQLDQRTLLFALVASLTASVLFGVVPALRVLDRGSARREGGRHGATRGQQRANRILVAVEVASAVVLLVGASLMLRSLQELTSVDPGFEPGNLVAVRVNAVGDRYSDPAALQAFYEELQAKSDALPGVTAVASIQDLPFGDGHWGWNYTIDSEPLPAGASMPGAGFRVVSSSYFPTLGVPILAGRNLRESDIHGAEEVAVVNDAFARRHFDTIEQIVGHTVTLNTGASFRVVGVVQGVRHTGFRSDPVPEMYRPLSQFPTRSRFLIARAEVNAASVGDDLQALVWDMDPDVPVRDPQTMTSVMRGSVAESRLFTELLGSFAALGAILAGIGVYGVVAYTVSRRQRAIAIRMALGAPAANVLRHTLREALSPVAIGAILGTLGAIGASQLLSSLLFGVSPRDPLTLVVVPVFLLVVATLAAALPATRAARVDPVSTLRQE